MKVVLGVFLLLPFVLAEIDTPIIGILTKEPKYAKNLFPNEKFSSFIDAQYVKFVEGSGGQVAPIWIGQNRSYYKSIVDNTNGLLLPGGATWFNETNGYAEAGKMLYDIAVEVNNKGEYYPIFGICLGMQLLMHIANNESEVRERCLLKNVAVPLNFKEDYADSKLFKNAPQKVINILKHDNVTFNYHQFCIIESTITSLGLTNDWKVISTNIDVHGLEFISSLEHKHYPFYGVQFHPEKNSYVHKRIKTNIPHSVEAIATTQYFANFFVKEARTNNHGYSSWDEEQAALIYNYNPRFVKISQGSSEQLYMFK